MQKNMEWPWIESLGMTEYESKEQRLHDEIVAYNAYISPTIQEIHARLQVIARIAEVVRRRYPYCTLETFGSTAQNLYLPDGDIDLCVTTPRPADHAAQVKMLNALSVALRESHLTKTTLVIRHARVPLVSFETIPELGSYKCDLSINSNALQGVPIINGYLRSMPALRYLVLVVKSYFARIELGSAAMAGLSSYSTILLMINYLQRNPQELPADDIAKPLENESLGRLLLGFFEHYGHDFDYHTSVVSVLYKGLLTKDYKGWGKEIRSDMLSIEDPTNPGNDVGKPTTKIMQVRNAFCHAYKELRTYPMSLVRNNVLGTIIGVSREVVKRRAKLKDMIDSGALDRALQRIRVPPPGEAERAYRKYQPQHSYAPYPSPQYQPPLRPYSSSVYRSPPPHLEHTVYGSRPLLPPVPPSEDRPFVHPPAHPPIPQCARPPVTASPHAPPPVPSYARPPRAMPPSARPHMPPAIASPPAPSSYVYGYGYEQNYARDHPGSSNDEYPNKTRP
ncbi:hypothetical protein FOMPIDRAFT_1124500 [Fomitopsis schrenkii]|uniref:polynucleotide adenylyltransferase n=1 Tax=Fomitopsis schrenkii TaxID=2126942 RepID=S8E3Q7_FOMSC|nr:hypothetical protein FOMPIDRAFT_1124500 [Fomitopsis schrenkii]